MANALLIALGNLGLGRTGSGGTGPFYGIVRSGLVATLLAPGVFWSSSINHERPL